MDGWKEVKEEKVYFRQEVPIFQWWAVEHRRSHSSSGRDHWITPSIQILPIGVWRMLALVSLRFKSCPLTLDQDTCVLQPQYDRHPRSMVAGSWEGNFHKDLGDAHGLEWPNLERHEHHSDSFCWWITSPPVSKGRIRLHLEEMAGSHYRRACRMGNTPVALYGKYILL